MPAPKNLNRSKYWGVLVDIVDAQFPKGECMERGRALMVIAYVELMLRGVKFKNGVPVKIKKKK
jgi:hypothetical protein